MAWCCERLKSTRACEVTVVHEVQVGSTVQQQSNKTTFPCTQPELLRVYRFNDTERRDILCATLVCAIPITELFRGGAKQYVRKVIDLLHWDTFDIKTIQMK